MRGVRINYLRYDIVIIIIFSTAIIQRYVYAHIVVIIFRFFPFRNPAVIISPYHHVGRRRFDRSNRPRATVVGSDRTTKRYINIINDYNECVTNSEDVLNKKFCDLSNKYTAYTHYTVPTIISIVCNSSTDSTSIIIMC